ncbi:Coenzyme Q-binding protein coq10a, mitochondrial [Coemansia biformis]|uniref:Coenzyme Q-binding protein coq10a, mitochondrial n=1 Tax=Coemansia biformis TaxID=1286918 RepID=A0A9W8CZL1_9FUNG|nr:Coenzyme Q-binding protein coq10a, mitochondrial [Coemansia biformis]
MNLAFPLRRMAPLASRSGQARLGPLWTGRRALASQPFHESLVFPYGREQVFDVVSDIDRYSEFVPLCKGSTVFHATRKDGPAGWQSVQAELVVGYPPFHERYTSDVVLERPRRIVATAVSAGRVFRYMRTVWEFADAAKDAAGSPVSPFIRERTSGPGAGASTRVSFCIEYEFVSALHAHAASLAFDRMARSTLAAYLARCRELYGLQPSAADVAAPRSNEWKQD